MGSFERQLLRNKIKQELKRTKQKRTLPISKYRFKTDEELQKEYATRLTEQMIKQGKESLDAEMPISFDVPVDNFAEKPTEEQTNVVDNNE